MQSEHSNHPHSELRSIEGANPSATHRLRSTLEIVFQDESLQHADALPSAHRELREALRQVCVDARHSGLRAEQLLVLIKDVWSGIPAGISRVKSSHGDERLSYVISTCVDEYYGNEDEQRSQREASP
jgi:hypothetical protein